MNSSRTAITGTTPPLWALIDPQLLDTIVGWLTADTITAQRQYLDNHTNLLVDPDTDAAFDEVALQLEDPDALAADRQLLAQANEHGVDTAYQPLLAHELLTTWLDTPTWDHTRDVLQQRRADLLAPTVRHLLTQAITDNPDDPTLAIHDALLDLAALDEDQAAFDTINDPTIGPDLLRNLQNSAHTDGAATLARLLLYLEPPDHVAAQAHLHLAIAATINNDLATAQHHARISSELGPSQAQQSLVYLVTLAPTYPQLTALAELLMNPESPDVGADSTTE